ncbi:hypothetical protein [Paenibacillus sp. YAF4_2]|uniref:hypothetical protein n=1 Tax=Paenibacillus sp. YAF4_2 TaxID=3233085 RepID=UPI003F9783BC
MFKKLLASLVLLCMCIAPSFALASAADPSASSELDLVRNAVTNFYESINNKDSELYLQSIANPEEPANQYNAVNLSNEDLIINFDIIDIEKVNDSKYTVNVAKTQNGVEYPLTPYDVILQDGQWRFDPSNIVFYDKKDLYADHINENVNVVSENENYAVSKTETNPIDYNEAFASVNTLSVFTTLGSLSYNFGNMSTDIYFSGTITVKTTPTNANNPSDDFVAVEVYNVASSGGAYLTGKTASATGSATTTFSGYYGYYKVSAYLYNYGGAGTFTINY